MEPTNPNPTKSNTGIIVAVIIVIIIIIVGVIIFAGKSSSSQTATVPATTPATTDTGTSSAATSTSSAYKDGTYSAVGDYRSPGGAQTVNVTLTLSNGIVTDSVVTDGSSDPESKHYQGIFIANYKQYVIGKSLDSISLTKVSGSSLTSAGFNAAVAMIKAQATA